MELQLKNIGMIKEANVKIDGLTVIAGENDTGKSTVGKALFALLKGRTYAKYNNQNLNTKVEWIFNQLSKRQLLRNNSYISFIDEYDFNKNIVFDKNYPKNELIGNQKFIEAIFIESPIVFNLYETFSGIAHANSILDFKITFPYLSWDLYLKLSQNSRTIKYSPQILNNLSEKIGKIIFGEFIHKREMSMDKWIFHKNGYDYEIENIATGIKQFGILQAIIKQGYLSPDRILILDEPEVHLHPKWQLKMAEIIIQLVKQGIKILVTSHSPYMIEALKRYSEVEEIEEKTNFYLAENGYIEPQESLENIFEKLALPMRELQELKLKRYLND